MDQGMVSDLKSHLGYWLRIVSNHVSGAFARKLEARDVLVAEWVMLRELYGDPSIGPSQFAEMLGMTRGGVSKLIDRLVEKGFLMRRVSDEDKRAQVLILTEAARALVPDLAALADANDAELFDHLDPEDRATLERILKGIVERRGLRTIPTE
jgi:DNA-binding MarR family transcriptional regulator